MAAEWVESTISDICVRVYSGGTPRSTVPAYFTAGTIPWLKTKEVRYEKIYSTESKITQLGLANSSAKIVPVNSVIVAMYGDGETAGRVGINKIPLTTNQACCNLLVNPSLADYRFVYYSLRLRYKDLVYLKNGGGQQNLNAQLIKSFKISLPPLSMQFEISDFLESLDDRIESLSKTNVSMEAIARAIFKSWFVDFDPVRAKAEGREPEGMDAYTASLFSSEFEEGEAGMVPAGWKFVPIGDLLIQTIGGDWGKDEPDEKHTERVAIIRGTDMPTIRSGFASGIPSRYTTLKKLESRALADGDIVIEVSGGSPAQPTGRSIFITASTLARFSTPVVPASFCRLFRPRDLQTGTLLTQHLTHIYAEGKMWGYQNQSTGISNFQTKHFLEVEAVCVPPAKILNAFHELVRPLLDRQQLELAQTLSDLRDTLLPRLISGKLRVPEAEAMLTGGCREV